MSDRERYVAAKSLNDEEVARHPQVFVRWLAGEDDWTVAVDLLERLARVAAAGSLAESDLQAVCAVIASRADDASSVVRAEVLEACRLLAMPSAVPLALESLNDSSHIVRAYAARVIEDLGGPLEAESVQRARAKERNIFVRHRFTRAIRTARKPR